MRVNQRVKHGFYDPSTNENCVTLWVQSDGSAMATPSLLPGLFLPRSRKGTRKGESAEPKPQCVGTDSRLNPLSCYSGYSLFVFFLFVNFCLCFGGLWSLRGGRAAGITFDLGVGSLC